MNNNFFSIPLDSAKPEDIVALDKEIDRLIGESAKAINSPDKEKHTA